MHKKTFTAVILAFVIEFLIKEGYSGVIYRTETETDVTHFEFLQRLGNPCSIVRLEQDQSQNSISSYFLDDNSNNTQFYQSMVIAVDTAINKLRLLLNSDQGLPRCSTEVKLDSLPTTPSFDTMNDDQLFLELYKSCIYLAAHLHLMGLDRELSVVGVNDDGSLISSSDDNIDESGGLASWRYRKCGNESTHFILHLSELALQMENILCTIVSSATNIQRASFRAPFNSLMATTFTRYHSSCSRLQMRDCLVLHQTTNALNKMSTKFSSLLSATNEIF